MNTQINPNNIREYKALTPESIVDFIMNLSYTSIRENKRPRAFITLYETTRQNGVSLFINKGIPTYVDDLEIYLDIDKDSTIESITEQLKGTPGIQSIKIL